jgi:hypothetical protein
MKNEEKTMKTKNIDLSVTQRSSCLGSMATRTWWTVSGTDSAPLRSTHVGWWQILELKRGGIETDEYWRFLWS